MSERVAVLETLRDAWQGLPRVLPTDEKVAFAQRLIDAGFPALDVGSFVSPARVPAMADTGDLLARLERRPGLRLTALVANEKGLQRLLAAPGVDEVLYPFSLSERFQRRNTNRGREEAAAELETLAAATHQAGRAVYATISMAFGNNEGDPYDPSELADWVGRLHALGVDRVGLADTTAQADAAALERAFAAVATSGAAEVPSVHLHCTSETQERLVDAALHSGCRAFDAALGGLGGCQFAKGAESNVSTLPLARQLDARGFAVDLPLTKLDDLDQQARRLAR